MSGPDLQFVGDTVAFLQERGVVTWLFGGWAEELLGMAGPRPHHDLDLLYPAEDFAAVDALMGSVGLEEITAKRFPHKRAFARDDVMTELILVRTTASGSYVTRFWDQVTYTWPDDLLTGQAAGLRVASRSAILRYRADHDRIHGHRGS